MTRVLGVLGSVTPPGRLRRALETSLEATAAGAEARLIDLREQRLGFADGRPPAQLGDDTPAVVAAIAAADAVIFASPVYRAGISGSLKNLLDLTPLDALAGKPTAILAMGATRHHALGVDSQLRMTLAWFGALVMPVGVYLDSSDFVQGALAPAARAELQALAQGLLRLTDAVASLPRPLGPPPLAARSAQ